MNYSLTSPSSGGAADYAGAGRTIKCPYIESMLRAPAGPLRPAPEAQTSARWRNDLIWFLILPSGLPTCLGLLGSLVGIGAGILRIILAFVHQIPGR
jgi:hypothetical protein